MFATFSQTSAANEKPTHVCERFISDISTDEHIPLGLLYAVALTETGHNGELNPYALNIEGAPFVGKTRAEAMTAFLSARRTGKDLIDVGCMQLNYRYHNGAFNAVENMFDPEENIQYAARFLKSLRLRHGSWTRAVARYHAGPKNPAAQHRYVCKVLKNLVDAQFGEWTPKAALFCGRKS
jgi:soluble lytic murein transglycosylase-like protein